MVHYRWVHYLVRIRKPWRSKAISFVRLPSAGNRHILARPISVTNNVFLLATPINCDQAMCFLLVCTTALVQDIGIDCQQKLHCIVPYCWCSSHLHVDWYRCSACGVWAWSTELNVVASITHNSYIKDAYRIYTWLNKQQFCNWLYSHSQPIQACNERIWYT